MPTTTKCYCDQAPTFDDDYAFLDGEGFECAECGANVYYKTVGAKR